MGIIKLIDSTYSKVGGILFNKIFKKWHGNKSQKDNDEEKNHREPIIVRIFKEDSDEEDSVRVEELPDDTEETTISKTHFFEPNHKYFVICVYALMFVAVSALIIYLIVNVAWLRATVLNFLKVIAPFWIGLMIAFILNPLISFLDDSFFEKVCKIKKQKIRTFLSVLIAYILFIGLVVFGVVTVWPQIKKSVFDLGEKLPELYNSAMNFIDNIIASYPSIDLSGLKEQIMDLGTNLMSKESNILKDIFPVILTISISVVKSAVNILLAIAISIYMVCDKRRLARASTRLAYAILPVRFARTLTKEVKECSRIFGGFIVGKAIDSLIIGILCFILMSILKLDYAVLLSVIVGFTNMIPYFGPIIGAIPGVLIYLCIDPLTALIFAGMILVLQQFDGWVLGPKILGDFTGIRPIWVIFAITVGGAYKGVLGMFLGVPVIAVVAYLIDKYIVARLKKKKIDIS